MNDAHANDNSDDNGDDDDGDDDDSDGDNSVIIRKTRMIGRPRGHGDHASAVAAAADAAADHGDKQKKEETPRGEDREACGVVPSWRGESLNSGRSDERTSTHERTHARTYALKACFAKDATSWCSKCIDSQISLMRR
jgi:hypothetical protein